MTRKSSCFSCCMGAAEHGFMKGFMGYDALVKGTLQLVWGKDGTESRVKVVMVCLVGAFWVFNYDLIEVVASFIDA